MFWSRLSILLYTIIIVVQMTEIILQTYVLSYNRREILFL